MVTLLTLSVRNRMWVVREEILTTIADVEIINNTNVRLTAMVHGRLFSCERPFKPTTLEELKTSVWRPVVSRRSPTCADYLFVEVVIAFNVNRELGEKTDGLVSDLPLHKRTAVVPHRHNGYCAIHDRAYYWNEQCPKCGPATASSRAQLQAA